MEKVLLRLVVTDKSGTAPVTIALSLLALVVVPTLLLGTAVALVISIAAIVETILATLLLRRKLGSIDGRRIGARALRATRCRRRRPAAGLAGTWGAWLLQPDFGPLYSVLASIVIALGMSVVYLLVLLTLRTPGTCRSDRQSASPLISHGFQGAPPS